MSDFYKVSGGPQETGGQPKCRNEIGNIDPAMGGQQNLRVSDASIALCAMTRVGMCFRPSYRMIIVGNYRQLIKIQMFTFRAVSKNLNILFQKLQVNAAESGMRCESDPSWSCLGALHWNTDHFLHLTVNELVHSKPGIHYLC